MGYIESLLAENEVIAIQTRQHWTVLAKSAAIHLALTALVIGATIFAAIALPGVGLAVLLLLFIPLGLFARDYLIWWNEEYLVTNRRVIQAEGVINKHVMDSSLEKVNDVVLDQSVFGRMFDYGDLEILTGSESGVNKLHRIVAPIKFKTEMLDQKAGLGVAEHPSGGGAHPSVKREGIPALIAELDALRKQGALTDEEFQEKKAQLLAKIE